MAAAHRYHDIADRVGEVWPPLWPGGQGQGGRPAQDHRRCMAAVGWILRTGAPWRDVPPDYGDGKNTHRRCGRGRDRGVWAQLMEAVTEDPDVENSFWDFKPWRGVATRYAQNSLSCLAVCPLRAVMIWAKLF